MEDREDYIKMIACFTFVARRRYEGDKEYLIFAGASTEAEEIARKLFGSNSVTVVKVGKTDNPLVYEL